MGVGTNVVAIADRTSVALFMIAVVPGRMQKPGDSETGRRYCNYERVQPSVIYGQFPFLQNADAVWPRS